MISGLSHQAFSWGFSGRYEGRALQYFSVPTKTGGHRCLVGVNFQERNSCFVFY